MFSRAVLGRGSRATHGRLLAGAQKSHFKCTAQRLLHGSMVPLDAERTPNNSIRETTPDMGTDTNEPQGDKLRFTGFKGKFPQRSEVMSDRVTNNENVRGQVRKRNDTQYVARVVSVGADADELPDLVLEKATEPASTDKSRMSRPGQPQESRNLPMFLKKVDMEKRDFPPEVFSELKRIFNSPALSNRTKYNVAFDLVTILRGLRKGNTIQNEEVLSKLTLRALYNPEEDSPEILKLQIEALVPTDPYYEVESQRLQKRLNKFDIKSSASEGIKFQKNLKLLVEDYKINSCPGCGSKLQSTDENLPGHIGHKYVDSYVSKRKTLEGLAKKDVLTKTEADLVQKGAPELVCHRCYYMRHQNSVTVEFKSPSYIDVMKTIKSQASRSKSHVIYHVVSALDFPATVNMNLLKQVILDSDSSVSIVLVVNKVDLRPKGMTHEAYSTYLTNMLWTFISVPDIVVDKPTTLPITKDGTYGLGTNAINDIVKDSIMKKIRKKLKIIYTSAKSMYVKPLAEDIRENRIVGNDVFFVGYTNVGKSSLINAIGHMHGVPSISLPVVMASAGTTVNLLKINMPLTKLVTDNEIIKRISTNKSNNNNKTKDGKPLVEQVESISNEIMNEDKQKLSVAVAARNDDITISDDIKEEFDLNSGYIAKGVMPHELNDMKEIEKNAGHFYDLPGWKLSGHLSEYLPIESINTFMPKQKLSKQKEMIRPGESLNILGLLQIDVNPISDEEMNKKITAMKKEGKIDISKIKNVADEDTLNEKLRQSILTNEAVHMYFFGSGVIKPWKSATQEEIKIENSRKSGLNQLIGGSSCIVYEDGRMNYDSHKLKFQKNTKVKMMSTPKILSREKVAIQNRQKIMNVYDSVQPLFEYKLENPSVTLEKGNSVSSVTKGTFIGLNCGIEIHLGGLGYVSIPLQKSQSTITVKGPKTCQFDEDEMMKPESNSSNGLIHIESAYGMVIPKVVEGSLISVRSPIPIDYEIAHADSLRLLKDTIRDDRREFSALKKDRRAKIATGEYVPKSERFGKAHKPKKWAIASLD